MYLPRNLNLIKPMPNFSQYRFDTEFARRTSDPIRQQPGRSRAELNSTPTLSSRRPRSADSLTRMVNAMPQFLRNRPIWFVTEHTDEPPNSRCVPVVRRLSPNTLSDLRYYQQTDYADYRTAVEAVEEHPHWLGGVGIHISPPLLVVIIRYCFQPSGTLDRSEERRVG